MHIRSPYWGPMICTPTGSRGRAEQQVVVLEELGPPPAHLVPRFVRRQPVAMGHRVGPHHARVVALVLGRETSGDLEILPEVLVGLPPGGRGAEELDVDALRFPRVDGGTGTVTDLDLLLRQEVGEDL